MKNMVKLEVTIDEAAALRRVLEAHIETVKDMLDHVKERLKEDAE